jgi:hypothetical protein
LQAIKGVIYDHQGVQAGSVKDRERLQFSESAKAGKQEASREVTSRPFWIPWQVLVEGNEVECRD